MSDVREAAERLLKFEKDCNFYGWPTRFDRDLFMEALTFVSIYLAEHPADEHDAVTGENLMLLGFQPDAAGALWLDGVCWLGGDKFAYDGVELRAETLGEVRTMLKVVLWETR